MTTDHRLGHLLVRYASMMMSIATGSRTSNKGAENPGSTHLRSAPSKISSRKYSQKSFFSAGILLRRGLAGICLLTGTRRWPPQSRQNCCDNSPRTHSAAVACALRDIAASSSRSPLSVFNRSAIRSANRQAPRNPLVRREPNRWRPRSA